MKGKVIFLVLISCFTLSGAQNKNIQLLAKKAYTNASLHGRLSNLWGHTDSLGNEYAIVGLQYGISIVDITDTSNLTEVFYTTAPASIWREIRSWDDHAVITNETSGGLMIIDMSALPGTITPSDVYYHTGSTYPFTRSHSLHIDENGIAYIFGANYSNKGAILLDLNNNPKAPAEVGIFDSLYLHDGFVRGDTLWGAAIYAGFFIVVDMSIKTSPTIITSHFTSGFFTHNTWLSDNGNYLFTTDEVSGAAIGAYDVSDLSNIDEIDLVWSNPGSGVIPHNTYVLNDFLVTSYYRDGITVVDATNPDMLVQTGNYDTSPSLVGNGFNGSWGVYPYFPSGKVIASDIENGLFVLGVNYVKGAYLKGEVYAFSDSSSISNAKIRSITASDSTFSNLIGDYKISLVDSGLHRLICNKAGFLPDTFDIFLHSGQMHLKDFYLRSNIPFGISGTVIDQISTAPLADADVLLTDGSVILRAKTNAQGIYQFPVVYEGSYEITAGKWEYENSCSQVILSNSDTIDMSIAPSNYDDFAFNNGWTVKNGGLRGFWQIQQLTDTLIPVLDYPYKDAFGDCSDFAYVTGRSSASDHDVDGGWNWLISPEMDASNIQSPVISFSYWFRNNAPAGQDDSLFFYLISGSDTVELCNVHNAVNSLQAQWIDTAFYNAVSGLDMSILQLAAKTGDFGSDNLLEAGLDHFRISTNTSIEVQKKKMSGITIFPNPADEEINYILPSDFHPVSFRLLDVSGRQIASGNVNSVMGLIEIPACQAGIYVLEFRGVNGEALRSRFIRQ